MSITAEILNYGRSGFERRFAINDPFFAMADVKQIEEMLRIAQIAQFPEEVKFLGTQQMQELTPEFPRKDTDRDKELFGRVDPRAQFRQAARWDDAMYVRMVRECLPPGMQNGRETEGSAEIFLVGRKLLKSFGDSAEEERVKLGLILIEDRAQVIRHGKDNVEVRHVEKIMLLVVNPAFFGERLTFRAMTVAAGIVGYIDCAAAFAFVNVRA